MRRPLQLLAGFSGSALIAGLSSLVTIPMLVSGIGAQPWAIIAASQALGTIIAVPVQLGWGATGTAEVATMPPQKQFAFYSKSIQYRSVAYLLCMAALALWLVSSEFFRIATVEWNIFVIVGFAGTGLSSNWFFVGTKNPKSMLLNDALPRAIITISGALGTMIVGDIWTYSAAIIGAALVPVLLSSFSIAKNYSVSTKDYVKWEFRADRRMLLGQLPGLATALVATVYKQLPLLILATVSPAAAAPFALIDRIYKFALAGLRPISQLLQATIPAIYPSETAQRAKAKIPKMLMISMIFSVGYLTFALMFGEMIGSNSIKLSSLLVTISSLALFMSFTNQWLGMGALVALDGKRELLFSVTLGACICAITIFPLINAYSSIGAMLSIAIAETVIFSVQLFCVRKRCALALNLSL